MSVGVEVFFECDGYRYEESDVKELAELGHRVKECPDFESNPLQCVGCLDFQVLYTVEGL